MPAGIYPRNTPMATITCRVCGKERTLRASQVRFHRTCGDPTCTHTLKVAAARRAAHAMATKYYPPQYVTCIYCGTQRRMSPKDVAKHLTCGNPVCKQRMYSERQAGRIERGDFYPLGRNTVIEQLLQAELEARSIRFSTHKRVAGRFFPDIVLTDAPAIIEADGEYWHNRPGIPERDAEKTAIMEQAGYIVFRFREHEIYDCPAYCIDQVLDELERHGYQLKST